MSNFVFRYGIDALLHRLHTNGILGPRSSSMRPLALGGLHRLPSVPVHSSLDNHRPILFSKNRSKISKLADEEQGDMDGDDNVDHPSFVVLHQHHRVGTFCWV